MTRRTERLNSLLKEVISDVIRDDVRHPDVSHLLSVISVDISKDLHHAKVYISVIGEQKEKVATINALNSAAGFIATRSSKMVVMRYFPALKFFIDDSVDKLMAIDKVLRDLEEKKNTKSS
jgi:ribosome-binding factor A